MYRVAGTSNEFKMFCKYGIATWVELRSGWSWINDKRYYEMVNYKDSIFTNPIPLLKSVWLYDPVIRIKHIDPGNHSLFLRHSLTRNHNFVGRVSFKVILLVKSNETNEKIKTFEICYIKKFMNQKEADEICNDSQRFSNTYATNFNTDEYWSLSKQLDSNGKFN